MTLFLIALAVGLVAAVLLWKLGQRTPPDPKDRKPRPIAQALWHIGLVALWLAIIGDNFHNAWTSLGDAISQLRASAPDNLGVLAIQVQDARLELVESNAIITALLIGLAFLISRLIEAVRRHRSDVAAKLQETHP